MTWNDHLSDPDNPQQLRQIDITVKRGKHLTLIECRIHRQRQGVKCHRMFLVLILWLISLPMFHTTRITLPSFNTESGNAATIECPSDFAPNKFWNSSVMS